MTKFRKPDIKYEPGKIRSGDFGIPPYVRHYCDICDLRFPSEEAYNEHMARYHPDVPKEEFDNLKPFDDQTRKDRFNPHDRARANNVIDGITGILNEFDRIDDRLDDVLSEIEVTVTPDTPLFYEACMCPRCGFGRPTFNYDDIQSRKIIADDDRLQAMGASEGDSQLTPSELQEQKEKRVKDSVDSMVTMVWRQFVIWVLEFVYSVLKPLERVPVVNRVPRFFKRALRRYRRRWDFTGYQFTGETGEDDFSDIAGMDDDFDIRDEVIRAPWHGCIVHHDNFDSGLEEYLRDNNPSLYTYYNVKKNHGFQRANIKSVVDLVGSTLVDIESDNGNALPISEDTAQMPDDARIEDCEPPDLRGRAVETAMDVARKYVRDVDTLLDAWYTSPKALCCFIYNILVMFGVDPRDRTRGIIIGSDEVGFLKMVRGVLEATYYYKSIDYKNTVKHSEDMVVNFTNSLLHGLIGQFIRMFAGNMRDELNKWRHISYKIGTIEGIVRDCTPFEEIIIDIFPKAVEDLLHRLNLMLSSFWRESFTKMDKTTASVKVGRYLLALSKGIDILNQMIGHMDFWVECMEEYPGYSSLEDVIDSRDDIDDETLSTLQDARNVSTTYNRSDIIALDDHTKETGVGRERNEPYTSTAHVSYDDMKVLLHNIVEIPEDEIDEILIDGDDTCPYRCRGGFRPEEIDKLRSLFD